MASPTIQIACALLWNILAAGTVFGFAALKPVLIAQGVYDDMCSVEDPFCAAQDMKLNLMFTIAAGVTNICALLVGFILDSKGPRVCGFIGAGFLTFGSLLLAYSNSITLIDPYVMGYTSLAIGGPFVFISTFQLANAVPQHSGKILAAITGAFDSSSALFLLYRLYFQNVQALSLKTFFIGYLAVPIFIIICQVFVMPRTSYRSLGAVRKLDVEGLDENGNLPEGMNQPRLVNNDEEREDLLHRHMSTSHFASSSEAQQIRRVSRVSDTRRKSVLEEHVTQQLQVLTEGVYGMLHGKSVSKQICSPWFWNVLILTVLCMLRLNYFMATVRSQEEYLLGSRVAGDRLGDVFDVALPTGGLLAIPLIGLLIDNVPTVKVLKLMCIASVLIGVLGVLRSFTLNLIGILLLVVYRPFYYTVISDYCAKVFGFETFGTVYGLIMTVSGVLNLLQTVVDRLTHTVFHMNPIPMNLLMTAGTALASVSLIYYAISEVQKRQQQHLNNHGTGVANERSALLENAIVEE